MLLARVGEAHIHLCLDGAEPPATVHLFDASVHHEDIGYTAEHVGSDVAATDDAVRKSDFALAPLPLATVASIVFLLPIEPPARAGITVQPPHTQLSFRHYPPPLRGPPALTL